MNRAFAFQKQQFAIPANSKHYLLLFILWPFLALITAMVNYRQREARKVVYIFLIYYGLTFVNNNEVVDAFRYAYNLKVNAQLPFSYFFKIIGGLNSDTTIDIVEPLVSFIVSRFTASYGVYFAVWAGIYGFFYLKSIDLLYPRQLKNPGWNTTVFLIFFIMILPITAVNGVRMWTAAWIFFYGAYHVVLNRDPKYLLLTFAASFFHWSFISANVILLVYHLAGNRNMIYIPLALASFVVPQIISPLLQVISLRLGGAYQRRYENYGSEGYIQELQQAANQDVWFLKIGGNLVFYYLIIAIIITQVLYGSFMKRKEEKNLFSFLLLFLAFVNFGMPIPSFGGRFQVLFFLFATLYLFLFSVKISGEKLHLLTIIGLFPMLLYSLINFRMGSESISAWIFTPGLGLPLLSPVLSLSEVLFP
jgi:hypothetical protein